MARGGDCARSTALERREGEHDPPMGPVEPIGDLACSASRESNWPRPETGEPPAAIRAVVAVAVAVAVAVVVREAGEDDVRLASRSRALKRPERGDDCTG